MGVSERDSTTAERRLAVLFPLVSFFGAFLLFQVQPIVSKLSLPFYGGAAAVWNTAMMFFQGVLLLGYAAAHSLSARCTLRAQLKIYLALLFAGCLFAFLSSGYSWQQPLTDAPVASLLISLSLHVGVPFLALSVTAPLLQSWFAQVVPNRSPYLLYAASNAGSLLALLSYPFLIEPLFGLLAQQRLWSSLYAVALLVVSALGILVIQAARGRDEPAPIRKELAGEKISSRVRALWLGYSALSSVILFGTTSVLCYDVAPMPLFLVIPLAVYLLTFILCFSGREIYIRPIYYALFIVHVVCYGGDVLNNGESHVLSSSLFMIFLLYASCMICHGELYRLRPASSQLTEFYLQLSIGGFIGSVCAAIVAPLLFSDGYQELPIALGILTILISASLLFERVQVFPGVPRRWDRLLVGALPVIAIVLMCREYGLSHDRLVHNSRSFYGILRVYDNWDATVKSMTRHLVNGRIRHGSQLLDPDRRFDSISYYGPQGGLGLSIAALRGRGALRVGVVGLGAGAAMNYAESGDYFRLYELNPDVIPVAHKLFTYLGRGEVGPQTDVADSLPRFEIVEGDGRLTLAAEKPQQFDLLLIDAFTSDAIPTHLLTVEALTLYFTHLKSDGVLLLHISNRHLDLVPVVARLGRSLKLSYRFLRHDGSPHGSGQLPSSYAALARDAGLLLSLGPPLVERTPTPGLVTPPSGPLGPLWTDDYTSLFGVLKLIPSWQELRESAKAMFEQLRNGPQ